MKNRIVLIGLGNENPLQKEKSSNIGFIMLDKLAKERDAKWERIGDCDVAYLNKDSDDEMMLVKPLSKDEMIIDKKAFQKEWDENLSKKLEHDQEYYGYNDSVFENYGYNDQNFSGIGVLQLQKKGLISPEDNINIVSHNKSLAEGEYRFILGAKYLPIDQNIGTNSILIRNNDLMFNRIDLAKMNRDESSFVLFEEWIKNSYDNFKTILSKDVLRDNDSIHKNGVESIKGIFDTDDKLNNAINYFTKISKDEVKIGELFSVISNMIPSGANSVIRTVNMNLLYGNNKERWQLQMRALKFMYFVADKFPDQFKSIKSHREITSILSMLTYFHDSDNELQNYNKPLLPIYPYIEEKISEEKPTIVLSPVIIDRYYNLSNAIMFHKCELRSLLNFEIDIFDKKHYESRENIEKLMKEIDEIIQQSDLCLLQSDGFNPRDEFKLNSNIDSLNLHKSTNDVIRHFWESYIFCRSAEKGKGTFGVCGGFQKILLSLGFYIDELEEHHFLQGSKDDVVLSPTLGRRAKIVSRHFQGAKSSFDSMDIKSNAASSLMKVNSLQEYFKTTFSNQDMYNEVIKDIRMVNGDGERNILGTQYHPELMLKNDDRSQEIISEFIHTPVKLINYPEVLKILENYKKEVLLKRCKTLDEISQQKDKSPKKGALFVENPLFVEKESSFHTKNQRGSNSHVETLRKKKMLQNLSVPGKY